MRPNLINRLKEEWNNLDPVDPLRGLLSDAIDALADQQPQQEPLGFMNAGNILEMQQKSLPYAYVYPVKSTGVSVAVYTTPQAQRTWVGLTDEEKSDIWCVVTNRDFVTEDTHVYADAIEAKLKEKNT